MAPRPKTTDEKPGAGSDATSKDAGADTGTGGSSVVVGAGGVDGAGAGTTGQEGRGGGVGGAVGAATSKDFGSGASGGGGGSGGGTIELQVGASEKLAAVDVQTYLEERKSRVTALHIDIFRRHAEAKFERSGLRKAVDAGALPPHVYHRCASWTQDELDALGRELNDAG